MTKLTVWYDGTCPLYRREIALMWLLDWHGAIDFVEITDAAPAACPIDRSELLQRFHAHKGGNILSGAAAFSAMWQTVPLLRPLGLAARSRWVLASLERFYLAFLPIRPRLQRLFADR